MLSANNEIGKKVWFIIFQIMLKYEKQDEAITIFCFDSVVSTTYGGFPLREMICNFTAKLQRNCLATKLYLIFTWITLARLLRKKLTFLLSKIKMIMNELSSFSIFLVLLFHQSKLRKKHNLPFYLLPSVLFNQTSTKLV